MMISRSRFRSTENGETSSGLSREFAPHPFVHGLLIASVVVLGIGVLTGNPGGTFVGLALACSLALSFLNKPRGEHVVSLAPKLAVAGAKKNFVYATLTLSNPGASARYVIHASFPGTQMARFVTEVRESKEIELSALSLRTGAREHFLVKVRPFNASGDWVGEWEEIKLQSTIVLPPIVPLRTLPSAPTARGLTGPRTSRKLGDGSEFRDLNPMQWGDSQRRIDWKASAKNTSTHAPLIVRRSFAQAEATTVVILDSRDDLGPEIMSWGSLGEIRSDHRTSLDLSREAAVSITAKAIERGDRVGFEDLARPRHPIPPGTGRRHLERIRYSVAMTSPYNSAFLRVRPPHIASGSTVFFLSTFLDEGAANVAMQLVAGGHQVVAVDVLPELSLFGASQRNRQAYGLLKVSREARLRSVRSAGIPIVKWIHEDERNTVLAQAAHTQRMSR